jgi:hypothetical protein
LFTGVRWFLRDEAYRKSLCGVEYLTVICPGDANASRQFDADQTTAVETMNCTCDFFVADLHGKMKVRRGHHAQ